MNITAVKVYDLPESLVASGLPMCEQYSAKEFETAAEFTTPIDRDYQRAERLASMPDGSGHKTFLSGILVSMNVTATIKWWVQFQRYHHQQIVSSMSTMHRLRPMIFAGTAQFHNKVDERIIEVFNQLVKSGADDETIAYSCPAGLELTARVSTNYLQLRTMYIQRKNHKLTEWREFCKWIETLQCHELITN